MSACEGQAGGNPEDVSEEEKLARKVASLSVAGDGDFELAKPEPASHDDVDSASVQRFASQFGPQEPPIPTAKHLRKDNKQHPTPSDEDEDTSELEVITQTAVTVTSSALLAPNPSSLPPRVLTSNSIRVYIDQHKTDPKVKEFEEINEKLWQEKEKAERLQEEKVVLQREKTFLKEEKAALEQENQAMSQKITDLENSLEISKQKVTELKVRASDLENQICAALEKQQIQGTAFTPIGQQTNCKLCTRD